MLLRLFFAALLVTAAASASETSPLVVRIESGAVRGSSAGGVDAFEGIPYARPPVGPLRWRPPQAAIAWTGIHAADKAGPQCMQPQNVPKSEDCLTVNVWRPQVSSAEPLPVMVWMHGNGFVGGNSSLYPGDRLAAQGIVVVSFNYRMGRLGFFALPALAREAPNDLRANYGILDQLAALRWVHRNIAAFGGDPGKVTIAGESAGGGSVLVMLASPLARGLFRGAILESPGMPTARAEVLPLQNLDAAEKLAIDYARSLGVAGEDAKSLAMLRAMPASTFVQGFNDAPILDGRLITAPPERALLAGRQTKVPVLVGANDADSAAEPSMASIRTPDALFAVFGTEAQEAQALYDPDGDADLQTLIDEADGDRAMREPVRHLAGAVSRSGEPVYLYRFSYVPQAMLGQIRGVATGMEIPFVFDIPEALTKNNTTDADRAMAALTSAYWVSFVKTGDPNAPDRTPWVRNDPQSGELFNFTNDGARMESDPFQQRLDLWKAHWEK